MANSIPLKKVRRNVVILCCIGIMVSGYAYHVETQAEHQSDYKAMCDVNSIISCSKTFTSKYGRGFGFVAPIFGKNSILNQPNSIFGIIFYITQMILGEINLSFAPKLQFKMSVVANLGSVYLAYILAFILKHFCFVCVSMYVLNFGILYYNRKRCHLKSQSEIKKE